MEKLASKMPRVAQWQSDKIIVVAFLVCLVIGGIWKALVTPPESSPLYVEKVLLPALRKTDHFDNYRLTRDIARRIAVHRNVMPIVHELMTASNKDYQENLLEVLRLTKADMTPAIPDIVAFATSDIDPYVRVDAIHILGRKGAGAASIAVPALFKLAKDEENPAFLRRWATSALGEIGPAAVSTFSYVRERMLAAEDGSVAEEFGQALSRIGLPDDVREEFFRDIQKTQWSVRLRGLASALKNPDRDLTSDEEKILVSILARERDEDVSCAIARALDGLRNPSPEAITAIAKALGKVTHWDSIDSFTPTIVHIGILSNQKILDAYNSALLGAMRDNRGYYATGVLARLVATGNANVQAIVLNTYLACERASSISCDDMLTGIRRGVPLRPGVINWALQRLRLEDANGERSTKIEKILVLAGEDSLPLIDAAIHDAANAPIKSRLISIRGHIPGDELAAMRVAARWKNEVY